MNNVLLLEDELKASRALAKTITELDESLNIVGSLQTVEDALKWLNLNPHPQLIFSDIQLADGLCFEIFKEVQVNSVIIFCTAFDEYLMDAFETNAISYILKPISKEKVEKALSKYYHLKDTLINTSNINQVQQMVGKLKTQYRKVLLLHERDQIIPVKVDDIAFFYLDKTLIEIQTTSNHKYFQQATLDELENQLDPSLFFRANRQFIVNKSAISRVEKFFNRKLVLKLSVEVPEKVVVSKLRAASFLNWLSN